MIKETTPRTEELKQLGWSTEDVARYSELWDYRQRWGAINLEREDRQFLRKAEASLPKIVSTKASTKKPINEKSYYRWLLFYLKAMEESERTQGITDGFRGLWPIILEEELRVLDYFEPVLGLPDTIKLKSLDVFRESIIKKTANSSDKQVKYIEFDFFVPIEELKTKEPCNWRTLREGVPKEEHTYPVFNSTVIDAFRSSVRGELPTMIRELLPSLAESDKPLLPNDWSRE